MGGDAPPIQSVADGTYILGEKLGAGSFGAIFVGMDHFPAGMQGLKLDCIDSVLLESWVLQHRT